MSGDIDDDLPERQPVKPAPWHNSTRTLAAASIAGVVAIALVVTGAMFVVRQFSEPEQAPLNYVEPSFTQTSDELPPPTTTDTMTSTRPPETTDINPSTDVTSGTETSGSETSGSQTPAPETPAQTLNPPRTAEPDDGGENEETPTSRRRPRLNETRTLYPAPTN